MKKLSLFLLLLVCVEFVQAQVQVSTHASSDTIRIDDDLIFDGEGNLYGSNFSGGQVYRISSDGSVNLFVDSITNANGLAFDSKQNLFVIDHGGNKIYKVAPDGTKSTFVSPLNRPSGIIKQLGSDTMLVTRYVNNGVILRVAPDGNYDTLFLGGLLNGPVGLVYDELGELYVGNFNDRKIIHLRKDGTQKLFATIPPASAGTSYLGFIAYADGMFYGTSFNANKIYQVRKSDTLISLFAGTLRGNIDGDTAVARFNQPNGIEVNQTGDTVFVSDYGSGNVRTITGFKKATSISQLNVTAKKLHIYPNPAYSDVNITVQSHKVQKANIRVMDLNGKVHLEKNYQLRNGSQNIKLSVLGLSSGVYFIAFKVDEELYYKQFVITSTDG